MKKKVQPGRCTVNIETTLNETNQPALGLRASGTGLLSTPSTPCKLPSVLILFSTAFIGCGGGGGGQSVAPAPPIVVSISAGPRSLAAEGQLQFQATVTNTSNTAVTWQVNGIDGGNASIGTITGDGLYTSPDASLTATIKAVSQQAPSISSSTTVTVLAPHRIGVQPQASGIAVFYDRTTGASFTPRGNNYIRLAELTDTNGITQSTHSTFNVGLYDSAQAETALAGMQASGYNTVRVFLNGCCANTIGDPSGGLSTAYMTNLVDFIGRAANHSIFVIFTIDWMPNQGGYSANFNSCSSQFGDFNLLNLCAGGIAAAQSFFLDVAQSLVNQNARLDYVLAYEIRNEYYYPSTAPPLSLTSGMVTTADGNSYDMGDATSRQNMMDNGLVYYTNQVRKSITGVDPTALVTVGFFWPQGPNPTRIGDTRSISVYPAIAKSNVDFVDIHAYSTPGDLTITQMMQNFNMTGYQQQKPVLMGEFGAATSSYSDITDAASVLSAWQAGSCASSIQGWLLWTWDTNAPEQSPSFWAATDGDGQINQALSPATNPNPCQ